ncbi:hypothetical protein BU14_1334s0002 [Porphyra umbilicalis]|uniref:Oxygen-evolving enhancer protein 3 n=1 Tax=Porphyra umbilicalis TaxID=2786 RepID=A0A1X6NM05_PORUM|nr:hypothetical protein BU14_1334s0002 [Porphyra umbilicalis]|eukprot:OSX69625.1 hypothetical protein BU14_1334s0002 [Porphyra umbilicalis]
MAFVSTFTGAAVAPATAARTGGARMTATPPTPPPTPSVSRRSLLSGAVAAAAAAALSTAAPAPARAESGGIAGVVSRTFFPKSGFNAPEAIKPSDLSKDAEALGTPAVKNAIKALSGYRDAVKQLQADFKADPQLAVGAKARQLFTISDLRNVLNEVDSVFDEESQKETDRVVRRIIQDVEELETSAATRSNTPRSPKKIDRVERWFEKLDSDFERLLSFVK